MAIQALNTDLYLGAGSVFVNVMREGIYQGYINIGNVPRASVNTEIPQIAHRENQTGKNAKDFQIDLESNCNLMLMLENYDSKTLELALYGKTVSSPAATVTDEEITVTPGRTSFLKSFGLTSFAGLTDETGALFYRAKKDAKTLTMSLIPASGVLRTPGAGTAPHGIQNGNRIKVTPAILGRSIYYCVVDENLPGTTGLSITFGGAALAASAFSALTQSDYTVEVLADYDIDLKSGGITVMADVVATGNKAFASYQGKATKKTFGVSEGNIYCEVLISGLNRAKDLSPRRLHFPNVKITPAAQVGLISEGNQVERYECRWEVLYSEDIESYYTSEEVTA